LLSGSPGQTAGLAAAYQADATASKELTFENNRPLRAAPVVPEIDATRFDPALAGLACERLYQPIIDQEKPTMNMYVEIQIQLPANTGRNV